MTGERNRRVADAAGRAIAFFYSIATLVPWTPAEHEAPTDFSWIHALHYAFLRHLRFGVDFVFTYGPWGFLYAGYNSGTYILVLVAWTFLAAVFVSALWKIVARSGGPAVASLMICLAVALIVAAGRETLLLVLPLLLFVVGRRDERARLWLLVPLLMAVSLAGLVKFSVFALATGFVLLVDAEDAVRRRRVPMATVAFIAATLAWWVAASQRLGDFVPFVRRGLELAGHYGEAMGRSERAGFDALVLGVIAVSCFVAAAYVLLRRNWGAAFGAAGSLLFVVTILKSGFAREGPDHMAIAAAALVIAGLIAAYETWPSISRRSMQALVGATVAVCALLFAAANVRAPGEFNPFHEVPWIDGLSWKAQRSELDSALQERLESYRDDIRGLRFDGSVDSYPLRLAAILDLPAYSPRPIPLSYAAYTTSLARLNADHLTGSRAPEWILFDIDPIDHRLPSSEDSLSWPILLERYGLAGRGERLLLLHRRDVVARRDMRPLATVSARFGEPVAMPAGPLWVAVDVEPTLVGRLRGLALKMPPIAIRATTADGATKDYRIVRDVARGGFLLSPLVASRDEFAAAIGGDPLANRRVVSIKLLDSSPSWFRCYRDEITVRLFSFGS